MLAGLGLLISAGCGRPAVDEPALEVFEGSTMGTYYVVKVASAPSDGERVAYSDAVAAELEAVNAAMSTWLPDSELSRFNRHASREPFAFSPATFEVLAAALEASASSGGAFDPTVAPLVEAWGFGPDGGEPEPPGEAALAELGRRVGHRLLELDPATHSARKLHPEVEVDLSGIAKGYAVDRVSARLAALGAASSWVEVGGEVRAAGARPGGGPWRVGIERPQAGRGAAQRIVALRDLAVATSGDYRNYRELEGERISHLIDPRTRRPIRHRLASVSVFHPSCMRADALATALIVLGPEEGLELARREGLAALFLVRDGAGFRELETPAFAEIAASGASRGRFSGKGAIMSVGDE